MVASPKCLSYQNLGGGGRGGGDTFKIDGGAPTNTSNQRAISEFSCKKRGSLGDRSIRRR